MQEAAVRPGHLIVVVHEGHEVPAGFAVIRVEGLEAVVAFAQVPGIEEALDDLF